MPSCIQLFFLIIGLLYGWGIIGRILFRRTNTGVSFPCHVSPSKYRPQSVHHLRPEDIEVIAAMGDSITAGNGAVLHSAASLFIEFRGHSFTMGGAVKLSSHITLPNILRKFNPNLYGYSTGIGGNNSTKASLNVADPGALAVDMPFQAKTLVRRLRRLLGDHNFAHTWKLINIFIGGNDICKHCNGKKWHRPANFQMFLKRALDILKAKVPRAFVNLITVLDASAAPEVGNMTECRILMGLCQCAVLRPKIETQTYIRELQKRTEDLVNSGRYDTKNDFTVVVQPFLKYTDVPRTSEGKVDLSYFAFDCFHFSAKLHSVSGAYLWKNMLEPVGRKTEKMTFNTSLSIACPSAWSPYLCTAKNSKGQLSCHG